jgi:hypothetical protein
MNTGTPQAENRSARVCSVTDQAVPIGLVWQQKALNDGFASAALGNQKRFGGHGPHCG